MNKENLLPINERIRPNLIDGVIGGLPDDLGPLFKRLAFSLLLDGETEE